MYPMWRCFFTLRKQLYNKIIVCINIIYIYISLSLITIKTQNTQKKLNNIFFIIFNKCVFTLMV